jgi:prepilin-type N-terminal cleavage/methylation domain-containing protein
MDRKLLTNKRGVTLIELLIVMAMLGMVMAAIYSLYSTHQKAAYTEDEVVEVQQNLRIAMDSITRDVRMAGFLIPRTGAFTPINAGLTSDGTGPAQPLPAPDNVNSDAITINALSTFGTYARIDPPPDTSFSFSPSGEVSGDFPVDSADSVDMFNTGDTVRIVRPQDRTEPLNTLFTVTVIPANRTAKTITLTTGSPATTVYQRGDIISKVSATAPNTVNPPSTITYCLGPSATCGDTVTTCPAGQLCLMRIENMTIANSMGTSANPVAANMAGLQFRYLMDDNSESNLPVSANFSQIRAVRVLLIGRTSTTVGLSGGQPKIRQVESVIQMRNR